MKYIQIILLLLLLQNNSILGQKVPEFNKILTKAISNGQVTQNILPFAKVSDVLCQKYIAYHDPINLPMLKEVSFKKEHLQTPQTILQSYFMCNTLEWSNSLSAQKHTEPNYNKAWFAYRNTQNFKKEYLLKIVLEFYFTNEGKEHCILMYFGNMVNGLKRMYPLILTKYGSEWKVSEDKNLTEFSGYLYLQPYYFDKIITNQSAPNDEFGSKYCQDGYFRLDQNFLLQMLFGLDQQRPYPEYTLNPGQINTGQGYNGSDVSSKKKDYIIPKRLQPFGIVKDWSQSTGYLIKYDKEKMANMTYNYDSQTKDQNAIFDSIPEAALAFWLFSKDLAFKKKHSIGLSSSMETQAKKYIETGSNSGRIEWLYKLVFSDNSNVYALIYFEDWYGKTSSPDGMGVVQADWIGEKSLLLKYVEGNWVVVLDPKEDAINLEKLFDKISFGGLNIMFSGGKLTGDPKKDWYYRGDYIGFPPDGKIYVNKIAAANSSFLIKQPLPNELERAKMIRGPHDRLRLDNTLPYWLDRK